MVLKRPERVLYALPHCVAGLFELVCAREEGNQCRGEFRSEDSFLAVGVVNKADLHCVQRHERVSVLFPNVSIESRFSSARISDDLVLVFIQGLPNKSFDRPIDRAGIHGN